MKNAGDTYLYRGDPCGTNSKKIYEKYAEIFGWRLGKALNSGRKDNPSMPVPQRPRDTACGALLTAT